jgi:hypothetical protein
VVVDDGWAAVTAVGRGVEDQDGFGKSSVALPGCAGASSIDRSGATMTDRGRGEG